MPPQEARISNIPKTGKPNNIFLKIVLFTTFEDVNLFFRHAIIIKF
jgi:hypothetical protein